MSGFSIPRDHTPKNCPLSHRQPKSWLEVKLKPVGSGVLVAWPGEWRECALVAVNEENRTATVTTPSGATMEVNSLAAIRVPIPEESRNA